MRTEKTKSLAYDRATRHALQVAFAALALFGSRDVALAKAGGIKKISIGRATQKHAASGSHEPTAYPTVSAYIENTFKRMPAAYTCVISQSNAQAKGCTGFSVPRNKNISRTFGMFYKASDLSESGFLFIVEKYSDAYSVIESKLFQVNASTMRYGWGIENFVVDSDESFHFQTTSGSASMPDSDIFRFKLRNGQWILSGHDHKTLSRCPDESIDAGSSYSINFLTSKVRIEIRNCCKHVKTIERQLATHPLPWASFDPSDSHLTPEAYGVAWH